MKGDLSFSGKIKAILEQEEPELTPLQEKLESLASEIGKAGL